MGKEIKLSNVKIDEHFSLKSSIVIHTGDTYKFLKTVPDEAVSLVISSPPYNIGKEYETKQSIESYLKEQEPIIKELKRIISNDGSICWQVGNYIDKGEVYPLDIYYYQLFKGIGLQLRNRIVWHFGHGLHASKRFSGRYETLLWFSKTDKYKFNLDSVRIPSKYPGKTNFKPGENYGKPSGNPLGKNPSDLWEFLLKEWDEGLWNIPNVKANHPEKTNHPCQFPLELVERCVLALTNKNDVVLDPYSGVGSTIIGSIKNDRKGVGVEKESQYNKIAKDRVNQFFDGTLKSRAIGTPVHVPTGREKVSQIPKEWLVNLKENNI